MTYPFTGYGGVTVRKQVSGERVYDINDDGVAHYGLYPDWWEDLEHVAGAQGPAIRDDMLRGAEAYLQMWERAEGVSNDACRQPSVAKKAVADPWAALGAHRQAGAAPGRSAAPAARNRVHLLRPRRRR